MSVCQNVFTPPVFCAYGGQKTSSDFLELELQAVMSC